MDKKSLDAIAKFFANLPRNQIPVAVGSLMFLLATRTDSEWLRVLMALIGTGAFANAFLNFNWKLPCKRRLSEVRQGITWPIPICPRDVGYLSGGLISFVTGWLLPGDLLARATKMMHEWGWPVCLLVFAAGYAPTLIQGTIRRSRSHDHSQDGCFTTMILFSFGMLAGLTWLPIFVFLLGSRAVALPH